MPKKEWNKRRIKYIQLSSQKFILQYWKTIVWAAVILLLSTMQVNPHQPKVFWFGLPHLDKAVHFMMYFILATIWISDYFKIRQICSFRSILVIGFVSTFYGVSMELIQSVFTTHRNGSLIDALFNLTGVLAALYLFRYLHFYRHILVRVITLNRYDTDS
jgi:VanZ family protein